MKAAIIAIGNELLGGSREETNSRRLAHVLEKHGVVVEQKSVVMDVREAIGRELRFALAFADVVILTGGLGSTEDDVTREAVSAALNLPLVDDPSILQQIRLRFESRQLPMPEVNRRQARVFHGQKVVPNARGTAPGFHLNLQFDGNQRHVWIFPGVPYELVGMIESDLEVWLSRLGNPGLHRRVIKLCGLDESAVQEKLAPFYQSYGVVPTILASRGEVEIHIDAAGQADEAYGRLTTMERDLRGIFGTAVFGIDEDTMEGVVGRILASRGETIATAESCTGGLLASRITDVSGSSAYFLGGLVTYSREAKLLVLGVDPEAIDAEGEVSEGVAREMAQGARRRFGSTWGIGITGIAGPTGGTAAKPVGTVHVAVASPGETRHVKSLFSGSREIIKAWSTQRALDLLRRMLVG
jgi:nicotinamide-nucleotide amidase